MDTINTNQKKIFTKKRAAGASALIIAIAIMLTGTFAYVLNETEIDETENSPGIAQGSPEYYAKLISPEINVTGWKTTTPTANTTKTIKVANTGEGNIWVRINVKETLKIATVPTAAEFGTTSPAILGNTSTMAEMDKIRNYINVQTNVKTVDQWVSEGSPNGAFWIQDTDGWCYWGQTIEGCENPVDALETESLNAVLQLIKKPSNAFTYTINAKLEAISDDLEGLETADGWNMNTNAEINPIAKLFGEQRFADYDFEIIGEKTLAPQGTSQLTFGTANGYVTTTGVTWESANPSVATVSNTGVVTGITTGTATITATGTKGTASVEVKVSN